MPDEELEVAQEEAGEQQEGAQIFSDELPEVEVTLAEEEPEPEVKPAPKGKHSKVEEKLGKEFVGQQEIERRFNELKWQQGEAAREAAQYKAEAQRARIALQAVERHNEDLRKTTGATQKSAILIAAEKVKESLSSAEQAYIAAEELGDPAKKLIAQKRLNEAQAEEQQLRAVQQSDMEMPDLDPETRRLVDEAKAPTPQAAPVEEWKNLNKAWFNPAEVNKPGTSSHVAGLFAQQLEQEGFDPTKPQFYAKLNERIMAAVDALNKQNGNGAANGAAQPQAPAQQQRQPVPSSPVAGVNRTPTNGKISMVLTPAEQKTALRVLGHLGEKEAYRRYAAEKAAIEKSSVN